LRDLSQWHTTALILSPGGEHWDAVPKRLATRMGLPTPVLKKWAGGRSKKRYKAAFEREFSDCLADYPVHTRVMSAQGHTIKDFFPTILTDLGLSEAVRTVSENAKTYLEFGPFLRATEFGKSYEPWTCKVPEHQAIPLLFICYFLLRAHHEILSLIKQEQPEIDWIDWQLMHNKFPGDVHGPMGSLFGAIMKISSREGRVSGNMLIGTFNDAKADLGNLLADNVAGYFSSKINAGCRDVPAPTPRAKGASLLWEIWDHHEKIGA
jgi:hypothetical protein